MRTLRIRKATQGILLVSYTVFLLAITLLVQGGHGVRTNLAPFEDLKRLAARARSGDVLSNTFLFTLVGIAGNLLIFAIWGFLLWKFLGEANRGVWRNTLEVLFFGALLSIGIETIQFFLPTRAADVNDVFWNLLGSLAGALLAHLDRTFDLVWE